MNAKGLNHGRALRRVPPGNDGGRVSSTNDRGRSWSGPMRIVRPRESGRRAGRGQFARRPVSRRGMRSSWHWSLAARGAAGRTFARTVAPRAPGNRARMGGGRAAHLPKSAARGKAGRARSRRRSASVKSWPGLMPTSPGRASGPTRAPGRSPTPPGRPGSRSAVPCTRGVAAYWAGRPCGDC